MTKFSQTVLAILLIGLNLWLSLIIQNLGWWHVKNYQQELFRFGWLSFVAILVAGLLIALSLKLFQKYPMIILIILVGFFSNIVERLYQGYVVDYINLVVGVANLADLQIYLGCIMVLSAELRRNYMTEFLSS
jgi:lipoprotein signal peptidase